MEREGWSARDRASVRVLFRFGICRQDDIKTKYRITVVPTTRIGACQMQKSFSASLPTSLLWPFAGLLLIVFANEMLVMYLLPHVLPENTPDAAKNLADSFLLTLFCSPLIWWTIARPLRKLAASEKGRAETILGQINDGVIAIAEDGSIVSCNRGAEQIFGYSAAEIRGASVEVLTDGAPGEGRQPLSALLAREAGAEQRQVWHELAGRRKDGSSFALEASLSRVEYGQQTLRLAILRDITEHKEADARLGEQKAFTEKLLQNSAVPTFVVDARHRVLSWNQACEVMTGLKAADLLGTDRHWQAFYDHQRPCLADLVIDGKQGDVATLFSDSRKSPMIPEGLQAEGWYPRMNGRDRYLLFHAAPVRDSRGEVIAAIETMEDITERQQRQQELEAISQLVVMLRGARTKTEIHTIILDQVVELTGAAGASIVLHDLLTDEMVVELGRGGWASATGERLPPGVGMARVVMAQGAPYICQDLAAEPRFAHPELLAGLDAVVSLPLIAHDQSVGVLSIGKRGTVSPRELRLLGAVGDIAANAIHRAALFAQTNTRLERLAALHNIDLAIIASMDLSLTLGVLLEQMVSLLHIDAAAVLLYQPTSNCLEFAAGRGFRSPLIKKSRLKLGEGLAGQAAYERKILFTANLDASGEAFVRRDLVRDEGFLAYCGIPLTAHGELLGVLDIFYRTPLRADAEWLEFLEGLGLQAAIAIEKSLMFSALQRSNADLVLAYDSTIEGWSRALDLRDRETEGHSLRVTEVTLRLARAMGMNEETLVHVRRGALLHDIGKMGIPDAILLKPGPLDDAEWTIMRQHPVLAFQLLAPIAFLRPALDIPYCHHEKWDGSGYPRRLKGEEIPLMARIFAVIDVWDALSSDRPYRPAWDKERVIANLREGAGTHFDPQVIAIFLGMEW